jgi:hypothetical protein
MVIIITQIKHLGISCITLFPFIILRDSSLKVDKRIMNHERIHICQQLELLILPFYILYLIEYVIGLIKYRNRMNAYLKISFEREAYKYDSDLDYLKKRKLWGWRMFIA